MTAREAATSHTGPRGASPLPGERGPEPNADHAKYVIGTLNTLPLAARGILGYVPTGLSVLVKFPNETTYKFIRTSEEGFKVETMTDDDIATLVRREDVVFALLPWRTEDAVKTAGRAS
jgi:hypothetical protein